MGSARMRAKIGARREPRLVAVLRWTFLSVWVLSATVLWYHYAGTRPKNPQPETGNIYELNTHGSVAYLTFGDCLRLYGAHRNNIPLLFAPSQPPHYE
jgi:hypothetical protein